MRVAAVVVAWNSARDLPACLAALDGQEHRDLEVVVVDNASDDGTAPLLAAELAASRRHPMRVVSNRTNRGFCGGVNDALAILDPGVDAVLLVNPDVVAAPDLVEHCVVALLADPSRGSIQPKLHRAARGPNQALVIDTTGHVLTAARLVGNRGEGELDRGQFEVAGEIFGASGALVLHRRTMLDAVAWQHPEGRCEHLTEDLVAYFDDVELDWRARLHGWTAWYEPAATAVHERGGAGPRRTANVEALNWANRLLVVATCDDRRSLLRAAPLVTATTLLKTLELAITVPRALPAALGRLRLLPASRRRRRQLLARATLAPSAVVEQWVEPFRWRPWVATWWRRITQRRPGPA